MSRDVRKAAVLLTSLPPAQMAGLLARLPGPDILTLADELADVDPLDPAELRTVLQAFKLAESAQAAKLHHATTRAPFEFLRSLPVASLWEILADEHPQTLALVLAHLPAKAAAALLAAMPDIRQADVAGRLATIDPVDVEFVDEVEQAVERRASEVLGRRQLNHAGGPARVAEIVCALDRTVAAAILDRLAKENPAAAADIRRWIAILKDLSVSLPPSSAKAA